MHKFHILATILVLIPLQILCNSTAEYSNAENDVEQLYTKIDELLSPSNENPLEGIQFLNENAMEFLNMVGPIASIIRKITDSTEFESLDKKKAIEIAKNFTEDHFMPLHDKYRKIRNQDNMYSLMNEYEDRLNFDLEWSCQQNSQKMQEGIEIYALATAVLDPLDKYAKEELEELLEFKDLYMYRYRFGIYWTTRTRIFKLTWMEMNEAKIALADLNKTINDYFYCRRRKECGHINAMGILIGFSELRIVDDWWNMRIDKYCLPKAILQYNEFKRKPIYDLAKIFTIGLIRSLMTDRICSELGERGESLLSKLTVEYANKITAQTQQWIEYHLNNAWPSIPRAMAIRIAKSADLSNINNWNKTSSKISTELNEIGPPGFIHRTIITEPWNEREWYSAVYNKNYIIEINDIDLPVKLIIIRFKKTENRTENGINFTKKLSIEKREIGIKILSENWKSKDMDSLLFTFLNATGLYGPRYNHFRGVLLLHNLKLFPFSCKIRSAFSTNEFEDGIELLQFHKNGFPKCEIFNIFIIM